MDAIVNKPLRQLVKMWREQATRVNPDLSRVTAVSSQREADLLAAAQQLEDVLNGNLVALTALGNDEFHYFPNGMPPMPKPQRVTVATNASPGRVYVVWSDPDPGYAAAYLLGVFTTREAAEQQIADLQAFPDAGVLELVVDEPVDEPLAAR